MVKKGFSLLVFAFLYLFLVFPLGLKPLNVFAALLGGALAWKAWLDRKDFLNALLNFAGFGLALALVLQCPLPKELRGILATLGFGLLAWSQERGGKALPLAYALFGVYGLRFLASALLSPCCDMDFVGIHLEALKLARGFKESLFEYYFLNGKQFETIPQALQGLYPHPVYHHTGHPGLIVLAFPLAFLLPKAAALGFKVLAILTFGAASALLSHKSSRGWAKVMALWLFLSPNLHNTVIVEANISSLAAGLVGLGLFLRAPRVQGVLLAAAAALKLSLGLPVALMPALKPRSRWLWAWGSLAGLTLLGLVALGPQANLNWLKMMAAKVSVQWQYDPNFQISWFLKGFQSPWPLLVSALVNWPLAILLVWRGLKLKSWPRSAALWVAASLHVPSYAWHHHLLPAMVAGWAFAEKSPWLLAPLFLFWLARGLQYSLEIKVLVLISLFAFSLGLLLRAGKGAPETPPRS